MIERYDCSDPNQAAMGMVAATEAVRRGELVVLPTDTAYGVGVDAFTPWAVERLRAARGVKRRSPVSVLVGTVRAAAALTDDLGPFGQDLIDEFWPGGLTLVCREGRTLQWDLGDTKDTVAVRMPLHRVALDLLKATGPMAVSSANTTGRPAATTADEAMEQLGDSVSVYLDGGPCGGGVASTIIDLTGSVPRLLRAGAISMDRLREVAALVTGEEVNPPAANGAAGIPDTTPGPAGEADPAGAEDATGPQDAQDASLPDGPPDIPSDSPADARADALTAASDPGPPAETAANQKPARTRKPASPRKPAARKPPAAKTSAAKTSAETAEPGEAPAATQKPAPTRKPATTRKPAAERKTTPRRTAPRKPASSGTSAPAGTSGNTGPAGQPSRAEPDG